MNRFILDFENTKNCITYPPYFVYLSESSAKSQITQIPHNFKHISQHENETITNVATCSFSLQIPNFLMSQVRKLNENSNRRYQFYDRRIKNLLRKIHTDSRDKPDKNTSEVSGMSKPEQ